MALSATPTLTEIKAELGSSANDLISFIAAAGKTGVFDDQLDFSGYSYNPFYGNWKQTLTTYFNELGIQQSYSITSNGYGWTIDLKPTWVVVSPSTGASGITNITIDPSRNLGAARDGTIVFRQNTSLLTYNFLIFQDGSIF
ncbi:MAG: hypothetical protein P1P88_01175 [Bacteroidales bacterium]|nr:hypothetical protein [Bacteroidales bacterium]